MFPYNIYVLAANCALSRRRARPFQPSRERATTRTRDAQSPTEPGLSASQRRRIVRSCVDPPPEHTHTPSNMLEGGGVTKTASSVEWSLQALKQACSQEYPESAMCVQSLDDSLDSAIRITYRISLRSSSLREPRHPPLKVFLEVLSLYIYRDMYAVPLSRCPCAERTSHERRHTHTHHLYLCMKLVAKRERRENGLCAARAAHNVRRIAGVCKCRTRAPPWTPARTPGTADCVVQRAPHSVYVW